MSAKIEGLDELIKKLDNLQDLKKVIPAFQAGAVHVEGKISTYPRATIANSPGNPSGRWYERGFGTRTATGRAYPTSEKLRKKWTISSRNSGFTQVVGNNVSYGPYVHDPDMQAQIHAQRGWKTTAQVAEEETAAVLDFVKDQVDKILEAR